MLLSIIGMLHQWLFFLFLAVCGFVGCSDTSKKSANDLPSLILITSDPYTYGIGEIMVHVSMLPLHSSYQNVIAIRGAEANLNYIKNSIQEINQHSFDVIVFAHSDKRGFHLLRDLENKSVLISPMDLGKAINSPHLRYFYTSGCSGEVALTELGSASRAQSVIVHKGISMIPAVPFFAFEFFRLVGKGESPERAKNLAWKKINESWLYKFLIPLNEWSSGAEFTESEPLVDSKIDQPHL